MTENPREPRTQQRASEYLRVMRLAVEEAQAESRRLGVPNVYTINGRIYYELPDGELTLTPPPGFGKEKTRG